MSSNLKEVLRKYDKKKNEALDRQKRRERQVYERIPRIKEIDSEISKTGVMIARSLLNNPESYEGNLAKIKEKMNNLKAEKAFLLTENNIPLDYLDISYSCQNCKDTGFLKGGQKCSCLKQELIRRAYAMSNIEQKLLKENFDTFDMDLFSDEPFEDKEESPKQHMMRILDVAERFCLNFKQANDENLLLHGTTGLGKTFLCNCIAKEVLDMGHIVVYQTSFRLMEIVESHRFNRDRKNFSNDDYRMIFDADLLIIDDLGTELANSFTITEFFNIINSRLLSGKKTVISTNLSPHDMGNIYTDRVFSRLASHFTFLYFYGLDLRWETSKV